MQQVIRRGIKEIIVDEVPDPVAAPHHVLVRPLYSLISSGTETADIYKEGVLREVADNPSHLAKMWKVVKEECGAAGDPPRGAHEVSGLSRARVFGSRHCGKPPCHGDGPRSGPARGLWRRGYGTRGSDFDGEESVCAHPRERDLSAGVLRHPGQYRAEWRAQGAVTIGVDLQTERVELARKLGADYAILGSVNEAVAAITGGRGADIVIIAAAAKSDAHCRQGLAVCRDRGKLVVVGAVEMSFLWAEIYMKEIQLFMARAYGPGSYDAKYEREGQDYPFAYVRWTENRNMEEFLRLLATGRVQVEPLITHEFPLADAAQAYDTIMDLSKGSLAVVLRYRDITSAEEFRLMRKVEVPGAVAKKEGEIGIGQVGVGNLAKWARLPLIQKMSGMKLVAVHSSSGARGKSYGLRFGASYATTDYEEILKDPQVDAVFVISRNQHHASQTIAALEAGKHVFVEKPKASTEDGCRAVARAARQSGRALAVGFNRRFAPDYVDLKAQVARRQGPAVVQCRNHSPGLSGSYWMADPLIGGAVLGEACHFVDLMCRLLEAKPLLVSAYSLPRDLQEPIGENNVIACFRFADGSIGCLTYCTAGSASSGGERVEVYAQVLGALSEDFKRLEIKRGDVKRRSRLFAEKGYEAQPEEFAAEIRKGRQPKVSLRDGVRAALGCLKILESARTLATCAIDLDTLLVEE